ncbi:MAG: Selenide, water dikinase [Phycisphaerae bacterium]|nr:Selenide, water dikinase [Phycisphaerae bacterium]
MGSLAQVVRQLPATSDPRLLVGMATYDDAGVFRLNERQALVQTVDFFPPLVDDPFIFGQIAAANSLSDIYAMGGAPLTALNIVGFPDKELPLEVLSEILRGGSDKVAEAGAVLLGGHSVRDSEVKYGLAVTGLIDPAKVVTNAGAQPGDQLILTKPIGSGNWTTAAKKELVSDADFQSCIEVMRTLNRAAAEAMVAFGVHAATDITGYGLLGHAFEMATASQVTLQIDAARVPLLDGTLELARQGCTTRAHKSNLDWISQSLKITSVNDTLLIILAEAQTSGGLLISIPANQADTLLQQLRTAVPWSVATIGRVLERQETSLIVG